jgi:hypothetical protein
MLTIQVKTFSRKRDLIPPLSLPISSISPDADSATLTLRSFITHVVSLEVREFHQRQEEKNLVRALTEREISDGARLGKIEMGGKEYDDQFVSYDEAIDSAILAFQDGLYFVFIDGVQIKELDDVVHIKQDSQILFLRLVALAGG